MQLTNLSTTYVFAYEICTKMFEKQIKNLRNINLMQSLSEREAVTNYA